MGAASQITVETLPSPLAAVRRVLERADEAFLGVAFVQQRGVNLIEHQLATVRDGRLVCTTAFGSTTSIGLQGAHDRGLSVQCSIRAEARFTRSCISRATAASPEPPSARQT